MINFFTGLFNYFSSNWQEIIILTQEHLKLTLLSIAIAILIGVPLGILVSYIAPLKKPILGIANIMQAIPSLALLGFLIPFLGIGQKPAIVMIVIYSLLPIIKNTATGLDNIDPGTLEAAKGIGMTPFQILSKVKIPLALPVIMAGVRISAVASVGLVTIAAFIGAGGLGYLVYAGIRTVSNYQILSGAIPACIIALALDWYMGKVEIAVTPISLGDKTDITEADVKEHNKQKKFVVAGTALLLSFAVLLTVIPMITDNDSTVVIGSKNYTEQEIVAEMMAKVIEDKTDLNVELKKGLGSTATILDALKEGSLDISFDYTGTIFGSIMGRSDNIPPNEIYDISKDYLKDAYGFDSLAPYGFNNTYTFTVSKDTAEKYNLKTFSDLAARSPELVLGCTIEFMNRPDGLDGAAEEYGFNFKSVEAVDDTPRYVALESDHVQVIDAYSTDALVRKYDLVILEDDKQFFPPYHGFPIVTESLSESNPEVIEALELLNDTISDSDMLEMNYKVDELGEHPKNVALEFLTTKGLI